MKNKEITVYELMGLIKDGKTPKEIKFNNVIFKLKNGSYYSNSKEKYLFNILNDCFEDIDIPNLKVEILPEDDEWEDIEEISYIERGNLDKGTLLDLIISNLNQLIKNQKKIIEKLESKDESKL